MTRSSVPPLAAMAPVDRRSDEVTIEQLAGDFQRLAQRLLPLLQVLLAAIAGLLLFVAGLPSLLLFVAIAAPMLLLLQLWLRQAGPVLPILPAYLLIQAIVNLVPLAGSSIPAAWVERADLLTGVTVSLLLWFVAIGAGWLFTAPTLGMVTDRTPLPLARSQIWLAHQLLLVALLCRLAPSAPGFWTLLGSNANTVFSLLMVVGNFSITAGGFLGAYRWAIGALPRAWLWWLTVGAILFQSFATLLLSSAQGLVLTVLLGLWLGRPRRALPVTLVALVLVGVLQQGKAVVRERYWDNGTGGKALAAVNPTQLVAEWIDASLNAAPAAGSGIQRAGVADRISNLYNLFYVVDKLEAGTPPMDGGSLAVIPQVLVPRVFNPDKVRGQEGQVLLNLHFGRQQNRAQTEVTYIAWGFLPEAVGNFGSFFGPLLYGVVVGMLLRISENVGRLQPLLSVAGLLSLAVTVVWLTSYEMVASTFVGSIAQIITFLVLLTLVLGSAGAAAAPRR
jgi:hypothetical protein